MVLPIAMEENSSDSQTTATKKKSLWRKLYDWTTGWAEKPYGVWMLFVVAFAESSFFPIPPDVLLIALCAGAPKKSLYFASVCLIGSVLGGIAGYGIGYGLYESVGQKIVEFKGAEADVEKIKLLYDKYGFWGNLIAAVTPIPYKIFTITSGAFSFNFPGFIGASIIGRGLRFFIVGSLIFKFGKTIIPWIERNLDKLAWLFIAILIGAVYILKFLH